MRRTVGIAALGLAASLLLVLAPAAKAGQYIGYKGRTDQGKRSWAVVHRTDADRLFLDGIQNGYDITCEDASTQTWIVGFFWSPTGPRLDDHRRVHVDENFGDIAFHYDGRMAWRGGSGFTKWTVAALDADEQAMTCTSGRQGWSLSRYTWVPTLADGKDVALETGYARVRVTRSGTAKLVRFRAPLAR
jgi:hypothetical protein